MNIIDFVVINEDLKIDYSDIDSGGWTLNREIVAEIGGGEYTLKQKLRNGINLKIKANSFSINRISFDVFLDNVKKEKLIAASLHQKTLFADYDFFEPPLITEAFLKYSHSLAPEYKYCFIDEYKIIDILLKNGKVHYLISLSIIEIPFK
jgi:hypothetical protein